MDEVSISEIKDVTIALNTDSCLPFCYLQQIYLPPDQIHLSNHQSSQFLNFFAPQLFTQNRGRLKRSLDR